MKIMITISENKEITIQPKLLKKTPYFGQRVISDFSTLCAREGVGGEIISEDIRA